MLIYTKTDNLINYNKYKCNEQSGTQNVIKSDSVFK
jgi:hypothetical protein